MQEGSKLQKIREGIIQGTSSFISRNHDKVGELSVYDVLMNTDLRSAKVFISCDNISGVKKLNHFKPKIYSAIKEVIESKYLPSIEFIQVKNEEDII